MELNEVKKYVGKKCLIILKNNFNYTATIPKFDGSSFTIIDIFKNKISIDCDFISFIKEVQE